MFDEDSVSNITKEDVDVTTPSNSSWKISSTTWSPSSFHSSTSLSVDSTDSTVMVASGSTWIVNPYLTCEKISDRELLRC